MPAKRFFSYISTSLIAQLINFLALSSIWANTDLYIIGLYSTILSFTAFSTGVYAFGFEFDFNGTKQIKYALLLNFMLTATGLLCGLLYLKITGLHLALLIIICFPTFFLNLINKYHIDLDRFEDNQGRANGVLFFRFVLPSILKIPALFVKYNLYYLLFTDLISVLFLVIYVYSLRPLNYRFFFSWFSLSDFKNYLFEVFQLSTIHRLLKSSEQTIFLLLFTSTYSFEFTAKYSLADRMSAFISTHIGNAIFDLKKFDFKLNSDNGSKDNLLRIFDRSFITMFLSGILFSLAIYYLVSILSIRYEKLQGLQNLLILLSLRNIFYYTASALSFIPYILKSSFSFKVEIVGFILIMVGVLLISLGVLRIDLFNFLILSWLIMSILVLLIYRFIIQKSYHVRIS
jgi:hypothetical protein